MFSQSTQWPPLFSTRNVPPAVYARAVPPCDSSTHNADGSVIRWPSGPSNADSGWTSSGAVKLDEKSRDDDDDDDDDGGGGGDDDGSR